MTHKPPSPFAPRIAATRRGSTVSRPRKTRAAKAALAVAKVTAAARDANLSPLELHALQHAGKQAKHLREHLTVAPGQMVDVTIRLTGAMSVADDHKPAHHAKPDLAGVLAHVLHSLDDAARLKAVRAAVKAYEGFAATGTAPEVPDALAQPVDELVATLTHHGTKPQKGNVSGAIAVEVLSRGRLAA